MKTKQPEIFFARYDEQLPSEFLAYAKPANKTEDELSERQIRKWKSRRVAYFLLHRIFEKYHLDTQLLTDIKKTASGRPYIEHPEIDFNISHSGDWVAVIFSVSSPKKVVGIDIEHPQKIRRFKELLAYYADEQEIVEIQQGNILPQLASLESRFYLSWCLREAVLKSQGVGIVKLSEVKHSLSQLRIHSSHCPAGRLCFYHQLPFYLACFFEQPQSVLSLPPVLQWQNGSFIETQITPIIYQVN